jgi:catechol 2,3-dioxygenase-like lactoylglutathione lyase family enzyme
MKRLHINISVEDLDKSVHFYEALFDTPPTVLKSDYAKWMLEDPRVNFSLSTKPEKRGVDHLGIQVENSDELSEVFGRLKNAEGPKLEQGETTCCYAQSEKTWIFDPEGVAWETFLTIGESPVYGEEVDLTTAG